MRYEKVDLYAHFSVERPEGALGELTCWYTETSPKVSVSRRRPAVLILPGGAYTWTSPTLPPEHTQRFLCQKYPYCRSGRGGWQRPEFYLVGRCEDPPHRQAQAGIPEPL